MNERRIRNQKGAAVTGLVLALFMFVMLIGFFAFDSSRLQMAQRELTATCDAAALAGTAMLTSAQTDNDDATASKLRTAQAQACGYARNMFQSGNLLGKSLINSQVVSPLSNVSQIGNPGDTRVMVALADPLNQYVGVAPNFPDCLQGRAVMVFAGYTYAPVFLGIVGVQKVLLSAYSGGGLPQVDAVLVFDYSGSMDDATYVTFVRRTWDSTINGAITGSTAGFVDYARDNGNLPIPASQTNANNHGFVHYIEVPPPNSDHRLSTYLNHDYAANGNGIELNVLPPQNLPLADNENSMVTNKYVFDWNLRVNTLPWNPLPPKSGTIPGSWRNDYGTPPGNCTLDYAGGGYGGFYTEGQNSTPVNMQFVGGPTGNGAYNPNAQGVLQAQEHPSSSGVGYHKYIASVRTGADNHCFTDLVVNIANPGAWPYQQPLNGPNNFVDTGNIVFPSQEPDAALAGQTFRFENIGVLVEASRGNLDDVSYFNSALLTRGSRYTTFGSGAVDAASTGLTAAHCAANYQKAYQRLAMLFSQPIATALDGANGGFFQKINSLTDCRFGFVGFSNSSAMANAAGPNYVSNGSAHSTSIVDPNSYYISTKYAAPKSIGVRYKGTNTTAENNTSIAGGSGSGFRQPRRALNKLETQVASFSGAVGGMSSTTLNGFCRPWSALSSQTNADGLENGTPLDNTDTQEALNTAHLMFRNGSSYNVTSLANNRPAAKHAIVFFTDGVPTNGQGAGTLSVANTCKGDGIAVFTIGLDVTNNPILQAQQDVFLGNYPTGLAGAAGNGGKFFKCATATTVKESFSAVARRLTQGQR
jgi:hypothetical protein